MRLSSIPRTPLSRQQLETLHNIIGMRLNSGWDSMESINDGMYIAISNPSDDLGPDATDDALDASCSYTVYRNRDEAFEDDDVFVGDIIISVPGPVVVDIEIDMRTVDYIAYSGEIDIMRKAVGVKISRLLDTAPFDGYPICIYHDLESDHYFVVRKCSYERIARVYFTNKTDFIIDSYKLIES